MTEKQKGLYQKYKVSRQDGKIITEGCFVLELKDPKARKALLTYATEVLKEGYDKELAYDLRAWVGQYSDKNSDYTKDVMLFDRSVLIKGGTLLDEETLYVVPTDSVDEYKNEEDLVLPAILSVDMQIYNKFHEEKAAKEKALKEGMDPLLKVVVDQIIERFTNSEYQDFPRFWFDNEDEYKNMLQSKYDEVGDTVKILLDKK